MKAEDIAEKPDSSNLQLTISKLRSHREELQLSYDGDDLETWLKVNDLPMELKGLLQADGAETGEKKRKDSSIRIILLIF